MLDLNQIKKKIKNNSTKTIFFINFANPAYNSFDFTIFYDISGSTFT